MLLSNSCRPLIHQARHLLGTHLRFSSTHALHMNQQAGMQHLHPDKAGRHALSSGGCTNWGHHQAGLPPLRLPHCQKWGRLQCHCCRRAGCGVLAAWPAGLNRRLNRPPVNPIPYLGTNLRQMHPVWWRSVGVQLDRTFSRSTATHATPDCQVATCRKKDKQHLQAHPDNTSGVVLPI